MIQFRHLILYKDINHIGRFDMRSRYSTLIYWIVSTVPFLVMTSVGLIMVARQLGGNFTDWWRLTIPKLIPITILTVLIGTIFSIPLSKTSVRFAPPLTIKGMMGAFGMTAIGVTLTFLFTLIRKSPWANTEFFFGGYIITILFLTIAIHIAIKNITRH